MAAPRDVAPGARSDVRQATSPSVERWAEGEGRSEKGEARSLKTARSVGLNPIVMANHKSDSMPQIAENFMASGELAGCEAA